MEKLILLCVCVIVTVLCNAQDACENHGDVRLWRGPLRWRKKQDYVQLCHNNSNGETEWRYVCDSGWGDNEATISCRQIGFVGVVKAKKPDWFPGSEMESITDLNCTSKNFSRLTECRFNVTSISCIYVRGLTCKKCRVDTDCDPTRQCNTESGKCELEGDTGVNGNGTECDEGYYGDHCELKECVHGCRNNGTCEPNGTCSCIVGYSGEFCGINESENNTQFNKTKSPQSPSPSTTEIKVTTSRTTTTLIMTTTSNSSNRTAIPSVATSEDKSTEITYTTTGADLFSISTLKIHTIGWITIAVSSVVILVLCCCHFFVIIPFLIMKRNERRAKFQFISTHEPFYESLQTVASDYQTPLNHSTISNRRKSEAPVIYSGDYTEMKLVYDNRDIIGEEMVKKINAEKRLFESSNHLYVQMDSLD